MDSYIDLCEKQATNLVDRIKIKDPGRPDMVKQIADCEALDARIRNRQEDLIFLYARDNTLREARGKPNYTIPKINIIDRFPVTGNADINLSSADRDFTLGI